MTANRPVEMEFFDAWTRPLVDVGFQPRQDRVTYLQLSPTFNYAGSIEDSRFIGEAAFTSGFSDLPIERWPSKMSPKMWLDWKDVHNGDGGGPVWKLYHRDHLSGTASHEVPFSIAKRPGDGSVDITDGSEVNAGALPYHEDISATNHAAGGEVHVRLDTRNRQFGTWLERPLSLRWHGVPGGRYTLSLEDNELFVPFDLRESGRYMVEDRNGETLSSEAFNYMTFHPGEYWRVYLRPQMWWFDITMLVHYLIVTPFASVPSDEIVQFEGAMRPPVWPYRHDILYSRTVVDIPSYFGGLYSWDNGINSGFNSSRLAVGLREAARDEEFHTISMAKLLLFNELPWCDIWTDAPENGDYIAAFDHIDRVSGRADRYLLRQKTNLNAVYPDRIIGSYLLDFIV